MSEFLHRIFHADDTDVVLDSTKCAAPYFLDGEVVLQARSVNEALGLIPDALREAEVDLAIIDGEFDEPHGEGKRNGSEIARAIRESGLSVAILSLSASPQSWGDENASKHDNLDKLAEAVKRLFAK